MGYSDITIFGSDGACDMVFGIISGVVKTLNKELKEETTSYNTPGPVNVALFIESFLIDNDGWIDSGCDDIEDICHKTVKRLDNFIKDAQKKAAWTTEENRLYHLSRYRELRKKVKKLEKKCHDW